MTANWTPTLGKACRLAAKATEERDRLILLAHEDGVPTMEIAGTCGMEWADVERITGVEPDGGPPAEEPPADKPGRRQPKVAG